MQRFFILRLDKDLRAKLERERTRLYQENGSASFFTFEPCIILGPVEGPVPSFVPCPPLPLHTQEARFEQGILHLPIEEDALQGIREACNTSWPTSGIYLGEADATSVMETLTIKHLRFAILNVRKDDELFRWHISEERYLDSDRDAQ
jgi:hypothetical protein